MTIDSLQAVKLLLTDAEGSRYEIGKLNVAQLNITNLAEPTVKPNLTLTVEQLATQLDEKDRLKIDKIDLAVKTSPATSRLTIGLHRLELEIKDSMTAMLPPLLLSQLPAIDSRYALCLYLTFDFVVNHAAKTAVLKTLRIFSPYLAEMRVSLALSGTQV